ncbi:MAG TPA: hypothetical protein VNZ57_12325 [Longimicrobiales bacterium]|nr:hypothetical protein [Longimicrobiales bacterium]
MRRRLTGRDLDVAAEEEGERHTPEEAQRILAALDHPDVDPRIRLLILAGGDALRGGQVVRCMRSDLSLASVGEFGLGRLKVRGRGKKRGSVIDVDPVLRARLDYEMQAGYLRECEAAYVRGEIDDYALCAQGRLVGGAVPVRQNGRYLKWASDRGLLEWFCELEEIAGVEHVPGRGWYGLRRLWTDLAATHLESPRAMEILASHARGSRISETVYRSKEDELAIREASRGRAAIREALASGKVSEETALRSAVARAMSTAEPDTLRRVLALLAEADPTRPETDRARVAGPERPPGLSQKLSDAPPTAGEASLSGARKSLSRGDL